MKHSMIAWAALLAAGCASDPVTNTVKVPVPVACQEAVPERPTMPTEQIKEKPRLDALLKSSLAENERREGYEGKLRTALQACVTPLQP